ncbi:PIN domain-containing protein [Streptomyces sp. E11-3]|uniref:PIN domain-containing protein n=1 Tax=Streptomyces sp. E11-3 TaxID=3110112 RepID=UPI00398094E4
MDPKDPRHDAHREALETTGHLVVSPMVLAELDYLITERRGARAAATALEFIAEQADAQQFEIGQRRPLPHRHRDHERLGGADGGKGVGLTVAMTVALAAAYRTDAVFTSDRHFRMMRPLTQHDAFRLLPDDL